MKTPSYAEFILSKRLSRIGFEILCVASFCFSWCGAILAAENPEPAVEVDLTFVNLAEHSPSIVVDIPYATEDNFLGAAVYPKNVAYLRKPVADRLARVQAELEPKGYGLKVLDGYRPLSVQRAMWKVMPDRRYVAHPDKGSRHNRGAAVDVTLVNSEQEELEMPTAFDDFSEAAWVDAVPKDETTGRHRQILHDAMAKHGFVPLATEWWHFDDPTWRQYPVEDKEFGEIELQRAKDEMRQTVEVLAQRVSELEEVVRLLRARIRELEKGGGESVDPVGGD